MSDKYEAVARLIETMEILRGPGGCPWDAEQTHESLVPYLLEEVYELVEAIEAGSPADIREELGDVLYQVLFHADIARASSSHPFTIGDVAAGVDEKMRQRHPHVFGDADARTVEEVVDNWSEIKAAQKAERTSVLDGIPKQLGALQRATSVVGRSGQQPPAAAPPGLVFSSEAELGELLLQIVQLARAAGLDAEGALRSRTRELEAQIRSRETSEGTPGELASN